MIGIPFIPISFLLLFLVLQPWMFYYAMPAKLIYVRGKRLKPYEWMDKPFEEMTYEDIAQIRDRVLAHFQSEMDESVEKYGKKPYRWKEFWRKFKQNFSLFPYNMPFGWHIAFMEFQRRWKKQGMKGKLTINYRKLPLWKAILKNPIAIAYFIPIIGWIPIAYFGLKGREKA